MLDAQEFRRALGSFVTGVTVVTGLGPDGEPLGVTVNSFSSVSLDPPLVLWSQSLTAPSYPKFYATERFAVNILSAEQLDVSRRFAGGVGEKFTSFPHEQGLGGVPLIPGAVAHIECATHDRIAGGDHTIFIGRVERFRREVRPPLLFGLGRYLLAYPHYTNADVEEDEGERRAIRVALPWIEELSEQHDVAVGVGVWGNLGPTIVHWSDRRRAVAGKLRAGTVLPLLTSACGRIFAAYLPDAIAAREIAAELDLAGVSNPRQRISAADDVRATLEEVRAHHLARIVDSADFLDLYAEKVTAVAAPVFDRNGQLVLSLTAAGYSGRLDAGWSAPVPAALDALARRVSAALGWREG